MWGSVKCLGVGCEMCVGVGCVGIVCVRVLCGGVGCVCVWSRAAQRAHSPEAAAVGGERGAPCG